MPEFNPTAQPGQQYVAGFMFSDLGNAVALIRKEKPPRMKGLLNAIGGKIEPGESPISAQIREFQEETGYWHPAWQLFCVLEDKAATFRVFFYRAYDSYALRNLGSPTEENVEVHTLAGGMLLPGEKVMPNLPWLIPMALKSEGVVLRVIEEELPTLKEQFAQTAAA